MLKKKILAFLLSALFCFSLLEIYLRLADPWGMYYFRDLREHLSYQNFEIFAPDWVIEPGYHEYSRSSDTVLENYTRLVPDTQENASCTLVTIGDSFTFGSWVNDDQTWVNQLARLFPDVYFINAGIAGYESDRIRRIPLRFPEADGYIYLIFRNDVSTTGSTYRFMTPHVFEPYVTAYLKVAVNLLVGGELDDNWPRFWEDLAAIKEGRNTLIFTYDDEISPRIVEHDPEVVYLDWEVEPLSIVNGHPTAASHRQVAALMQPHVAAFVEEICHSE